VFNTEIHKAKTIKDDKPYGHCTFFDKNEGCTIHKVKPLHCRVGNGCNEHGEKLAIWFALNYLVKKEDPQSIREWAIYLKTNPTIPGGSLADLVPDKERLGKMLDHTHLRG